MGAHIDARIVLLVCVATMYFVVFHGSSGGASLGVRTDSISSTSATATPVGMDPPSLRHHQGRGVDVRGAGGETPLGATERRSQQFVRAGDPGPSPPLANFLDDLQTEQQRRAMQEACPTHRRLRASASDAYGDFVDKTFRALSAVAVGDNPLKAVLGNFTELWSRHGGLLDGFWAEFGVAGGRSLRMAYDALKAPPSGAAPFRGVLAGFDSFKGLPVDWRPQFRAGAFRGKRLYETVRALLPPEVELYKGWFQDTIKDFLAEHPRTPAAFIHHDGDLFVSTAITFALVSRRIVPGTFMCFDELHGYPGWEQHEMLAFFLWMREYEAEVCAIANGLEMTERSRNIPPNRETPPALQSSCFQVLDLHRMVPARG